MACHLAERDDHILATAISFAILSSTVSLRPLPPCAAGEGVLPELDATTLERDGGFFGWVLRLVQQRKSRAGEFQALVERVGAHLEAMPNLGKGMVGKGMAFTEHSFARHSPALSDL